MEKFAYSSQAMVVLAIYLADNGRYRLVCFEKDNKDELIS